MVALSYTNIVFNTGTLVGATTLINPTVISYAVVLILHKRKGFGYALVIPPFQIITKTTKLYEDVT